jgi:alkaline phosphatase
MHIGQVFRLEGVPLLASLHVGRALRLEPDNMAAQEEKALVDAAWQASHTSSSNSGSTSATSSTAAATTAATGAASAVSKVSIQYNRTVAACARFACSDRLHKHI